MEKGGNFDKGIKIHQLKGKIKLNSTPKSNESFQTASNMQ